VVVFVSNFHVTLRTVCEKVPMNIKDVIYGNVVGLFLILRNIHNGVNMMVTDFLYK
jgi:hypothetical protein